MEDTDVSEWFQNHAVIGTTWYLKRLSANDTKANQSNQAGPYLSKNFLFDLFPQIEDKSRKNPDTHLSATINSHGDAERRVRVIWYNSKLFGKTRDETRITGWGGVSSPLLDPDSTGALAIFVFRPSGNYLNVWVCRSQQEEELFEDRTTIVDPGTQWIWRPGAEEAPNRFGRIAKTLAPCRLTRATAPTNWLTKFPSGAEIVDEVVSRRPRDRKPSDKRLLARRECEFEMFLSIEEIFEGARISIGFTSVNEFVARAQSILQRRKSRSGRSLELHLRKILLEENFAEGKNFSHQPESDPGKKPDFLFPSEAAYKDPHFPSSRLRMLAAKTTCKDRWRQVTHEASRIKTKHLLTLQEGVSLGQFNEMRAAGVQLVVPADLIKKYPKSIQSQLLTLEDFLGSLEK
jgi:hypothetical protein